MAFETLRRPDIDKGLELILLFTEWVQTPNQIIASQ